MKRNPQVVLKKRLEYLLAEVLEDIAVYGEKRKAVLFYKSFNCGADGVNRIFEDYDVVDKELIEKEAFDNEAEYEEYINEMVENDVIDETYNIIYEDEKFEMLDLKELLYVICEGLYPDVSPDVIVIHGNLLLKNISPYKCAKLLGISAQALSQFLNGIRPVPKERYDEICTILDVPAEDKYRKNKQYLFK